MKSTKRIAKENNILDAAEKIFSEIGFRNTRMEDVAKAVNMSKGSIYFYFGSKENLFMAVTYKAYQFLLSGYSERQEAGNKQTGRETVIAMFKYYMVFTEEHPGYYDLLMNYLSLIRAEKNGHSEQNLSEAMLTSEYYHKIKKVHHKPIHFVINELKRGQEDGSIKNKNEPTLMYLTAWAFISGLTEIQSTNRVNGATTILNVPVERWKAYGIEMMIKVLDEG